MHFKSPAPFSVSHFCLREQHKERGRNASASIICIQPWLDVSRVQSECRHWHWFVPYHKIPRHETLQCAYASPRSEMSTANLEGTALEKLSKKKGITCLQRLTSLTCSFSLANQPLSLLGAPGSRNSSSPNWGSLPSLSDATLPRQL